MHMKPVNPATVHRSPNRPYSVATRTEAGPLLHISGQVAQSADGTNTAIGDPMGQAEQVIANLRSVLAAEGATLANVCRLVVYVTKREHVALVTEVRKRHFREPFPAVTALIVSGLTDPERLVEMEATAILR